MPTLETRVISGKGLVRIGKDSADFKQAKVISVYANVIREPLTPYKNFNYNPAQSQYATLTFVRDDYVVRTEHFKYPQQCWDFYPDISAQSMYAIQCAYAGILQTFFNLGNALELPSISITDHIKNWRHQDIFFDTIKVVCYGSTALQIDVVSSSYDLCDEQSEPVPIPPPPTPLPPLELPPGTPLGDETIPVSPPYDGGDDGEDTQPFEGDEPPVIPDPPGGCWKTFTTYSSGSPSSTTDYSYGLSTDTPVLVLPPGGLWWQLRDGSLSGRLMRDNFVGSTITPTLVSAEWQPACESSEIYGIPPA